MDRPRAANHYSPLRGNERLLPLARELRPARLIRFDADELRKPSGLIPESEDAALVNERGSGLPGVYQRILGRGDDAFRTIRDHVCDLFPTVKNLKVVPLTAAQLVLEVELTDGARVRADRMSEGLLYFLGFSAIPHLSDTSLLLVEEPENGLHPARIADVMRSLRRLTETTATQVVLATHSPLVINCMRPEEVSLVTRPSADAGTKIKRLVDTPNFALRSSVYELGELWLSYADGKYEEPLLTGPDESLSVG